jgi:hypothetical protein
MATLLAEGFVNDDRRRVVNAGVRRGRETHVTDQRTAYELGAERTSSRMIERRGQRLILASVSTINRASTRPAPRSLALVRSTPKVTSRPL